LQAGGEARTHYFNIPIGCKRAKFDGGVAGKNRIMA